MKKVMFDLFIFIDILKNKNIQLGKNNLYLPYGNHLDDTIDFKIYDNTCKTDNYKRLFHEVKLLENNNSSNVHMNESYIKNKNNIISTNMNTNYFHIYDTYYMKVREHEIFF